MTSTSGFRDGGKQNICRNRKNIERASRERQKALYEQPGRPSPSLDLGQIVKRFWRGPMHFGGAQMRSNPEAPGLWIYCN